MHVRTIWFKMPIVVRTQVIQSSKRIPYIFCKYNDMNILVTSTEQFQTNNDHNENHHQFVCDDCKHYDAVKSPVFFKQ